MRFFQITSLLRGQNAIRSSTSASSEYVTNFLEQVAHIALTPNKRYDIAVDELTGEETSAILSSASGRKITYAAFDPEVFRSDNDDIAGMFV